MRLCYTLLMKSFATHVTFVRLVFGMSFPVGNQRGHPEIRIILNQRKHSEIRIIRNAYKSDKSTLQVKN